MKMSLSHIPTSTEAERLFYLFEKACNCLSKKICWEHIFLRVLQDRKDKTISEGTQRASKPLVVLLTLSIQSEKK